MATYSHMLKCLNDLELKTDCLTHDEVTELYNKFQNEGILNKFYSCGKKTKYSTMNLATKAAYNLEQIRPRQFLPYWCQWCGKYHIGGDRDRSMYTKYIRPEIIEDGLQWKL